MRRTTLAVIACALVPAAAAAQTTPADSARPRLDSTAADTAHRPGATSRTSSLGRTRRAPAASKAEVRELQAALDAAGYDVGTPDGVMGARTRRAAADARRALAVQGDDIPSLVTALEAHGGGSRAGSAASREGAATTPTRIDSGAVHARDSLNVRRDSAATSPVSPSAAPSGTTTPIPPTTPAPSGTSPNSRPATPPAAGP